MPVAEMTDAEFAEAMRITKTLPKKPSPGDRRRAFAQDPHGTLVCGPDPSGCQLTRQGHIVCKRGYGVRLEEARALAVATSLGIAVPTLHSSINFERNTEIVMDFVEGECLEEAWHRMNPEEKQAVALQIKDILGIMRLAKPEQRPIGSIDGPVYDCHHISNYIGGPFETEKDFNGFLLDLPKAVPSLIKRTIANALPTDSRIVFSHCDLSPRNIIVKDGKLQALLDWEYAGWYPEYWEYVKFFDKHTACRDWKNYAEVMFDVQYPKELLAYQALARWQKP